MSKATHNGTCQACGRVQAVKANGLLAKHGYTVDYGYFNGTCSGSDSKPLEQETSLNIEIVEAIRDWADQQDQLSHGNIETVPVRSSAGFGRSEDVLMNREQFVARKMERYTHTDDAEKLERLADYASKDFDDAVQRVRESMRRNANFARKDADNLEVLRDKTYGNGLIPRNPVDAPKPHRETGFRNLNEAYARAKELKAEGLKARVNGGTFRQREITVTYRK